MEIQGRCPTFVRFTNMEEQMEYMLHYVWQHRLYGQPLLLSDQGTRIEVIDPGVHNLVNAGPDFFNAKVRIDGVLWAGNVEVHELASDWFRHRHEHDPAYNNVILHVVGKVDAAARTADGKLPPQLALQVPPLLMANYRELRAEETYPPCYRVIPQIAPLTIHSWMSRLTVERLETKMQRIENYLQRTGGDWERAFFITLARNFGFSTNADAFEQWAFTIQPSDIGKHRDSEFQVEAFFMGQAGLLDDERLESDQRDDYFCRLQREYRFLQHKFGLQPVSRSLWKFGRLRPQNFPYLRLSQLTRLYVERKLDFSRLLETTDLKSLHALFRVGATPYWRTHYAFGAPSAEADKVLQTASLNLLVINTAVPLLFAYGRSRMDETLCERAFNLLESMPPERNYITRCWERAGVAVAHAADSQALIQLRQHYCDRKDCLRCRFGMEYLRKGR